MKSSILVYFTLIFLMACTGNAGKQAIIEPDKMRAVLIDIHLVDGYISTFMQSDTLKQRASSYYAAVYKHHKIDSIRYKRSLQYYSKNPKLLDTIYHKVNNELEALRVTESARVDKKRLDEEAYQNLKRETKGTLFKPYDIWFFKFTRPENLYPSKSATIGNKPINQDSLKFAIAGEKSKARTDSLARNMGTRRRQRMPELK